MEPGSGVDVSTGVTTAPGTRLPAASYTRKVTVSDDDEYPNCSPYMPILIGCVFMSAVVEPLTSVSPPKVKEEETSTVPAPVHGTIVEP
jgi:hypothetical protein